MKNSELCMSAAQVLDWMEENLTCDASEKIAILKSCASVIENNLAAESLKTMLYNIHKGAK